jgi:long-subunit acyl-CoA synthetase (AMP-forming)
MYTARHAAANPGQPAIIMGSSGETVSYAEYEARCNRLAHLLRAAGLRRGDHVSILMENQPRMLEIEGAAERAPVLHAGQRLPSADEVAYIATTPSPGCCFRRWPNRTWPWLRRTVARGSSGRLMTGLEALPRLGAV